MSMIAVGVGASAATGIAGAAIQANAAGDAADLQYKASQEANALQDKIWSEQKQMYETARNQQRADFEPWRTAGAGALSDMGNADFKRDFTAGDFQKDPGYDFRMAEGQKALERSAAARGGLQSGGMMKALSRYGQDYASGEYQNAYNRFNADRDRRFGRLSSISGLGQASAAGMAGASGAYASGLGQLGSNYANQMGSNIMGAASSAGDARLAQGNAWSGAISGIGKAGMEGAWMKKWDGRMGGKEA